MSQTSPDAKAVVRAAEALTTQVRRIADALSTPVVRTVADEATTSNDGPRCVCGDPIELRDEIDPDSWIHSPGSETPCLDAHLPRPQTDDGPTTPLRLSTPCATCTHPYNWHKAGVCQVDDCGCIAFAVDDGPTTPATTCSARYAGALVVGDCIRAAGHITTTDHTDASGRHYGDNLAVYPLSDSTVKVAHWRPVAEQHAEERQELAGMVGEFINAQMRMAPVSDKEKERTARRESIGILISRAGRGVITGSESELLRQWFEAELREADAARTRATQAGQRLGRIRDMVDAWERRLPATIRTATAAEAVRLAVAGDDRPVMFGMQPDAELRAELAAAQAAIERVRAECKAIAHEVYGQHDDDGKREAVGRVIAALDGTEQPTTEPGFTEQHANPDIIGTTEGP